MYTVFPILTFHHSAYQAHPFANALHSVTINVLIAYLGTFRSEIQIRFHSKPIGIDCSYNKRLEGLLSLNRCVDAKPAHYPT